MVKDFSKSSNQLKEDGAYHLKFGFLLLFSIDGRLELGNPANLRKFCNLVPRAFPFFVGAVPTTPTKKGKALGTRLEISTFRSERKKRSTSGGSPQFPNRYSGKLPFHLTSIQSFGLRNMSLGLVTIRFYIYANQ